MVALVMILNLLRGSFNIQVEEWTCGEIQFLSKHCKNNDILSKEAWVSFNYQALYFSNKWEQKSSV